MLSFLKDINSVIFAGIFMFLVFPACVVFSAIIFFMHIIEDNLEQAFSPRFIQFVTQEVIVLPVLLAALLIVWLGMSAVSWAISFARRPIEPNQLGSANVKYSFEGNPYGPLGDGERRALPTSRSLQLPKPAEMED